MAQSDRSHSSRAVAEHSGHGGRDVAALLDCHAHATPHDSKSVHAAGPLYAHKIHVKKTEVDNADADHTYRRRYSCACALAG
jgi:hypothetical protein